MCVVSAVVDQWGAQYPWLKEEYHGLPFPVPVVQPNLLTPATAAQMLEVIQKLEEIDKKLGALDCRLKESEKETVKRRLGEIAEGL